MKDCVSVECIYNDKLKKGMCIGLSSNTRSYNKDVVRLCWVQGKKPSLNEECNVETEVQMTPDEAKDIGVALILGYKLGNRILEVQAQQAQQEAKVREKTKEVK